MEKGFVMEENLPKQDGKLKENFDFDPRFDRITKAYEKLGPEHITKEIVVNYPHLKEGASCFADSACPARERRVEVPSPQAWIPAVPAVFIIFTK